MNLFDHVLSVAFGKSPKISLNETVTVCSVDGCMAETLTPLYVGIVVDKKRINCYGAKGDGKIPAIDLKVLKTYKGNTKIGEIKTELEERLRRLEDHTRVILT